MPLQSCCVLPHCHAQQGSLSYCLGGKTSISRFNLKNDLLAQKGIEACGVYALRSALRPGTAPGGAKYLALAKAWHHPAGLGVHFAGAISSLAPT